MGAGGLVSSEYGEEEKVEERERSQEIIIHHEQDTRLP